MVFTCAFTDLFVGLTCGDLFSTSISRGLKASPLTRSASFAARIDGMQVSPIWTSSLFASCRITFAIFRCGIKMSGTHEMKPGRTIKRQLLSIVSSDPLQFGVSRRDDMAHVSRRDPWLLSRLRRSRLGDGQMNNQEQQRNHNNRNPANRRGRNNDASVGLYHLPKNVMRPLDSRQLRVS
jgi:hypothetical protein